MSYNLVDPTTGELTQVAGGNNINDETTSTSTTWSSEKINDSLKGKADLDKFADYTKNIKIGETEDVDANNLRSNANYVFPEGYKGNVSNMPSWIKKGGGILECKNWGNFEKQVFYPYGDGTAYIRSLYYYDNKFQWTDWQELVTMDKIGSIPIEANRTITFSSDYTEISVYRCGYSDIRAHIEIDALCNIVSTEGWIQDMGIVLPEGYRPSENVSIPAWCISDTEAHTPITLMLGANGKLSGYIGNSHTSILRLNITATYFK